MLDPDLVLSYLSVPVAESRLREYFGSGRYTGGRFERLSGGGDAPSVANHFTADDVLAVSLLSVKIPTKAALLLMDQRPSRFSELLADVPNGRGLEAVDESDIGSESAAAELWTLIQDIPGCGWVTAGKLLARKRPHLVPVFDSVVKEALSPPRGEWWSSLQRLLKDESTGVTRRLRQLRTTSGIGTDISLLRILDVSVWMQPNGPGSHPTESEQQK